MTKAETTGFGLKNKLESEQVFKLSRFKEVIKRTQPHKHDGYFELIILLEGAGFHWVDTKLLPISPPLAFFLSPGQVHCWQLTAIPKGFVIMFRADFVDPRHSTELYLLVQQLEQKREILIPDPATVSDQLLALEKAYQNGSQNQLVVLRALLQLLLARLLEFNDQEVSVPKTGDLIFRRFMELLRQPGPLEHRVFHYASLLGVTPQHLNTICRRVHGKSASDLISEHLILEGKRFLLHTDRNVTEVAERLGFTDPSHFVKFFKRRVGQTPATFRKLIRL
ncbi:AraC family transcriptional regulator [Larkinella bovis]|uniref:AraC family transcriptional regulator n=1 Tax=Larkinella bovis TaxID=683041 RepID=A0ABW0IGJ5_9BACT